MAPSDTATLMSLNSASNSTLCSSLTLLADASSYSDSVAPAFGSQNVSICPRMGSAKVAGAGANFEELHDAGYVSVVDESLRTLFWAMPLSAG